MSILMQLFFVAGLFSAAMVMDNSRLMAAVLLSMAFFGFVGERLTRGTTGWTGAIGGGLVGLAGMMVGGLFTGDVNPVLFGVAALGSVVIAWAAVWLWENRDALMSRQVGH